MMLKSVTFSIILAGVCFSAGPIGQDQADSAMVTAAKQSVLTLGPLHGRLALLEAATRQRSLDLVDSPDRELCKLANALHGLVAAYSRNFDVVLQSSGWLAQMTCDADRERARQALVRAIELGADMNESKSRFDPSESLAGDPLAQQWSDFDLLSKEFTAAMLEVGRQIGLPPTIESRLIASAGDSE